MLLITAMASAAVCRLVAVFRRRAHVVLVAMRALRMLDVAGMRFHGDSSVPDL
jgi:hypothetical protein